MMRRSRDQMLMMMAEAASGRSTCSRLHVGAVIARDSRVISTGYNGVPAGVRHCFHDEFNTLPCLEAVHAEANAIIFAARHGVAVEGAQLFSTHEPCLACCNMIINAGISRVVWLRPYRDHTGVELLNQVRILTMSMGAVDLNFSMSE
jgi:dCMP deaminase